jgi:hypothetical protein
MALTERTEEDKIEILVDGTMQIRTATIIERDGVEISRSYHRHVIQPGDVTATQSPRVKKIVESFWTAELTQSFIEAKDKAQRKADGV